MSGPMVDPHEPASAWGEHGARLGGMTKRELIAAMAMQGILANPNRTTPGAANSMTPEKMYELMAQVSVEFAGALLVSLGKE